jgi:hypothetical protein
MDPNPGGTCEDPLAWNRASPVENVCSCCYPCPAVNVCEVDGTNPVSNVADVLVVVAAVDVWMPVIWLNASLAPVNVAAASRWGLGAGVSVLAVVQSLGVAARGMRGGCPGGNGGHVPFGCPFVRMFSLPSRPLPPS